MEGDLRRGGPGMEGRPSFRGGGTVRSSFMYSRMSAGSSSRRSSLPRFCAKNRAACASLYFCPSRWVLVTRFRPGRAVFSAKYHPANVAMRSSGSLLLSAADWSSSSSGFGNPSGCSARSARSCARRCANRMAPCTASCVAPRSPGATSASILPPHAAHARASMYARPFFQYSRACGSCAAPAANLSVPDLLATLGIRRLPRRAGTGAWPLTVVPRNRPGPFCLCYWSFVTDARPERKSKARRRRKVPSYGLFFSGSPAQTRTLDLRLRNPALYPDELRGRDQRCVGRTREM
jgi:hypothetical protein